MTFKAALAEVFNRGSAPVEFLNEMVKWARTATDEIFEMNHTFDIYSKVAEELGPWKTLIERKAAMLEVMRVLAGFESSWDWTEGVDTSRLGSDTPENSEAGPWQVSYDARHIALPLSSLLDVKGIRDGIRFQRAMKFDHPLSMEFVARLMRFNTKHNGPLYKGDERLAIRSSLRDAKHSIYPWLNRDSQGEFASALS